MAFELVKVQDVTVGSVVKTTYQTEITVTEIITTDDKYSFNYDGADYPYGPFYSGMRVSCDLAEA
jgi:hypothetical protein